MPSVTGVRYKSWETVTDYYTFWGSAVLTTALLQERGLDAIPILERGATQDEAGEGKETGLLTPMLLRLLRGYASQIDPLRAWLAPAAQAVIDRLLQRLSGPAEIADASELPAVLVTPPWRAAKKKQAATPLAIAPLPPAPVENWPEGAKENALSIEGKWQQKDHDDAQKSIETLVLNLFPGGNKDCLPQKEKAMVAIRRKNAEAFIAVWRETMDLRRKERGYFYERIHALYVPLLPKKQKHRRRWCFVRMICWRFDSGLRGLFPRFYKRLAVKRRRPG